MNEWDSTSLAAVIPEKWSKDVLAAMYSDNGVIGSVLSKFDSDKGRGDIQHIPVAPRFSTNAVGSDGSITVQNLTTTDNSVTMNVWREVSIGVIDRDSWQSVYGGYEGLLAQYKDGFILRLKEFVENDLLSLWSSVTTNATPTAPQEMNASLLRLGQQQLDEGRVLKEDRTLVLAPKPFWALMGDQVLSNIAAVGGQSVLREGSSAIPKVYGVKLIESQEVASNSGLYRNLIYQKQAIALAMSKTFSFQRLDKTDLTENFVADVLYGRGVIRETFASVINTKTV